MEEGLYVLIRGGGGTEVLSKQVSVVSFRRRVSSSTSSFQHLKYKHITSLFEYKDLSVHRSVSQEQKSVWSNAMAISKNKIE